MALTIFSEINGPMSVDSSAGSPTFIEATLSERISRNFSKTGLST
jgi:hypothetical protein